GGARGAPPTAGGDGRRRRGSPRGRRRRCRASAPAVRRRGARPPRGSLGARLRRRSLARRGDGPGRAPSPAISFLFRTTRELIKPGPVLVGLRRRGAQPMTVCTGQQPEQIPGLLGDFGLAPVDVWLAAGRRGRDLGRSADIVPWAAALLRAFARRRRDIGAR